MWTVSSLVISKLTWVIQTCLADDHPSANHQPFHFQCHSIHCKQIIRILIQWPTHRTGNDMFVFAFLTCDIATQTPTLTFLKPQIWSQSPEKGQTFLWMPMLLVKPSSFYRGKKSRYFKLLTLFINVKFKNQWLFPKQSKIFLGYS